MRKDKGFAHCLCGEAFNQEEESKPVDDKKEEWTQQQAAEVQQLVDQQARLTGADIQKALLCHLPLPAETEEKERPGE